MFAAAGWSICCWGRSSYANEEAPAKRKLGWGFSTSWLGVAYALAFARASFSVAWNAGKCP